MRNAPATALLALLTLASATPARAQGEGTKTAVEHDQVVSASPILGMFNWFNVDYERKIGPTVTVGASGSYLPIGDFDYTRATFHLRYYPQRAALTGFYVGGLTGVHRAAYGREHDVFFGAGMDLGYSWLFGPNRNVGLSLGIGATRLFGGDLVGISFVIPNVRLLNVGIAF